MAALRNKTQPWEVERLEDGGGQDSENVMLRVTEVARLLGVHPNTVRIWTDSGVLKSYRIGPRKDRRVPISAIRSMLELT